MRLLTFAAVFLLAAVLLLAAVTARAAESDPAEVARLRAGGQATLDAMIARTGGLNHRPDNPADAALIDAVAGQKDAWTSGLFWHTDLEDAQQQARREGKLILSLRLLGRLDSELSCANSRFFRVALYPDPRIRQILRDRFVLHWQSERPVPVVTIDYGDGRKLTRTITGNSIHYVLAPDLTPLDALPGLYAPGEFYAQLLRVNDLLATLQAASPDGRQQALRGWHLGQSRQIASLVEQFGNVAEAGEADVAAMYQSLALVRADRPDVRLQAVPAADARLRVESKTRIEAPLLRQVAPQGRLVYANPPTQLDDAQWRESAQRFRGAATLSMPAAMLFRSKLPPQVAADPVAAARVIAEFQQTMALDTAINEFKLRQTIRSYFVNGLAGDLESLNRRVYDEVFLTPASDPWLGLGDGTAFLAVDPAVAATAATR